MRYKAYESRKVLLKVFVLVTSIVFTIRLFYVQLIDERYVLSANNNVLRYVTIYPARGTVYDRNGKLLIYNEAAYDLMVIPRLVKQIDTLEFCRIVDITKEDFIKKMEKARNYSPFKESVFEPQINKESYGYIEEKLYKYPGFYVQSRTLRKYPHATAAHSLGYIGEVSPQDIENNPYYKMGDYVGKSGIEKAYEADLGGVKGLKIRMVDVFNREKGSYLDGRYDTAAISGNDITMTIDLDLQEYGEMLMKNKRGSIVAIEPSTGEILALISSPSYDPNLLVGRIRKQNYPLLEADSLKPLFNRALLATYPPGSTFKLAGSLIGLQEGVITPESRFSCSGKSSSPIKCSHDHYSPLALREAIQESCNHYFWGVFKSVIDNPKYNSTEKTFRRWREYLLSFNFGKTFNSDLTVEVSGNVPSVEYYDKYFGKNHWRSMTIRSLSIGQGELLITPLQMANMMAIIANRGFYYNPHIVKAINRENGIEYNRPDKKVTMVESRHFQPVIDGMYLVYNSERGTARWYRDADIVMCGKTGTVQNPHGKDHSVFTAFAPMDDPKIAIAVVVENAGFGSTYAAPIATLMMKKYLQGDFEKPYYEEIILEANMIE
jgi:penicillin-binding protein 2